MDYYQSKTLHFDNCYYIDGYSIVGPKEKEGKLGDTFDYTLDDDKFGECTFEKAERKMFEFAYSNILAKSNLEINDIDAVLGGDLLNQIVSASFAMRKYPKPFIGLYNACGTFIESMAIGATFVDGNYLNKVLCASGSHFSTAERQYRYPLELGVLRSPVSQWTATGVGCSILSHIPTSSNKIKIVSATFGRVIDYGIMDVNNMGAAMAPAAYDTLKRYFLDTKSCPKDFDEIWTGDLGKLGKEVLIDLFEKDGINIKNNYFDCGAELYYDSQKTYMGGSGAACSAIVLNGKILSTLKKKQIKRILVVGTGALMSPTTSFQGESIPSIAHLIEIKVGE